MEKTDQAESAVRRTGGGWQRAVFGLAVSVLALAAIFYFADLEKFTAALRRADYRLVGLAVFTTLAWLVVRGFFWQTLLRQRASYRAVFWTLNEGYLLNNVLPFRLGEVARGLLLSSKSILSFWEVLSSILIERLLDLLLAVALLLGTVPFVIGAQQERLAAAIIGSIVGVGLLLLYLAARFPERVIGLFESLAGRWSILRKVLGRAVPSILGGLQVLTERRRFLTAIVWVSLNWLVAIAQYYMLLRAFIPEARWLWAGFTLAVAALGIAAPSSPGAVGVFEAAVGGALLLFGVEWSTAVAFGVVTHLLQYVVTGVLGAVGLARDGESLAGLYRKLRRSQLGEAG